MTVTCFNCGSERVTVIRGEDDHRFCLACRAHEYRGERFTRAEWDAWVNADPELRRETEVHA